MTMNGTDLTICRDCGSSNPVEMNLCRECGYDFRKVVSYQTHFKQQQMSRKNTLIINLLVLGLIIGLFPMSLLMIFALTFTGGLDSGSMVFIMVYVAYIGFMIYLNKYKKSRYH